MAFTFTVFFLGIYIFLCKRAASKLKTVTTSLQKFQHYLRRFQWASALRLSIRVHVLSPRYIHTSTIKHETSHSKSKTSLPKFQQHSHISALRPQHTAVARAVEKNGPSFSHLAISHFLFFLFFSFLIRNS